jgi:starvation-inducible DNA-binding protein
LAESACRESVDNLNQLLADTITLRDPYTKHRWQVAGPTFYQLHLLLDKHSEQQSELVGEGSIVVAFVHQVQQRA